MIDFDYTIDYSPQHKTRPCLRCRQMFEPLSRFNRICKSCHQKLDGVFSDRFMEEGLPKDRGRKHQNGKPIR